LKNRRENELVTFKKLLSDAKRWRESKLLRDYIKDIEINAEKTDSVSKELIEWIEWANLKVDWYDPLINTNDDLLSEVDKENLTFKNPNSTYRF